MAFVEPYDDKSGQVTPERLSMVREQIEQRGIKDPRVLEAMRRVPREVFVPEEARSQACHDGPVLIGDGQTISQPFIVAFMSAAARVGTGDKVLEIGTGSGYQSAVLAALGAQVFSVEIRPQLAERARRTIERTGYGEVRVKVGDGWRGWPEEAPFDAILVTAAPDAVPDALLEQLRVGGRLVVPIGTGTQVLVRLTRTASGADRESLLSVRFVPMIGEPDRPRP
ncbi:MAG TPA: protein-L-isoaspartate(D-aspartate) O-methyltransferase [Patescibacteria group bacterium]|nr:protein-L-isoaspartate(D-aspartate) O-methyltransferase [Patescibacteria group bacterium]